jgi:hypothetical protein
VLEATELDDALELWTDEFELLVELVELLPQPANIDSINTTQTTNDKTFFIVQPPFITFLLFNDAIRLA